MELAHDAHRLLQHGLGRARVLLPGLRPRDREGRRLEAVERDDASFGLRDDALRDDDGVAVLEGGALRRRGLEAERGDVVALLHERDAAHADDADLGWRVCAEFSAEWGHDGRPSIRGWVRALWRMLIPISRIVSPSTKRE